LKVLSAGTKIICPECKRVMCILLKDMQPGDVFSSYNVQSVDAQITRDSLMECPYDNTPYYKPGLRNAIYTDGGGAAAGEPLGGAL
jgi:hypothetical protein